MASLSAMLNARWKSGPTSGVAKAESIRAGQVRSFRITKLDPASKKITINSQQCVDWLVWYKKWYDTYNKNNGLVNIIASRTFVAIDCRRRRSSRIRPAHTDRELRIGAHRVRSWRHG